MSRLLYLNGNELKKFPKLMGSMFRDRADQFVKRLRWSALNLDSRGWEQDEYDNLNPVYVIWQLDDGSHGASMRLLPTNGPNIISDHFSHIQLTTNIRSENILEVSRFVVSRRASSSATPALFVGAGELFLRMRIDSLVGLFAQRMLRVYGRLQAYPEILGSSGDGKSEISVGTWKMSNDTWERSLKSLGGCPELSHYWYEDSLRITGGRICNFEKIAA